MKKYLKFYETLLNDKNKTNCYSFKLNKNGVLLVGKVKWAFEFQRRLTKSS
jgi:hypothetical protein